MQVIRMLATKTALAARIDLSGIASDGSQGQLLRKGIIDRFEKIRAP